LFVLVKTSNPGSGVFQDTLLADGRTLFMKVAAAVQDLGRLSVGDCGYSDVGAVVGATYPEELSALRKALPACTFLLPGYGAQGGTAEGVRAAFDKRGYGAIVASSRGIIFAYEKLGEAAGSDEIRAAMLDAAEKARKDIQSVTPST
jgi:orotidine-5'-phosphate decarboxylase